MNRIRGIIAAVESHDRLSRVTVDAAGVSITAVVIDTSASEPRLAAGTPVELLFKETEVVLAKGLAGRVSTPNLLAGTVSSVNRGALFTGIRIAADGAPAGAQIEVLIGTPSADAMALREGDPVTALVNPNDITLGW